MKYLTDQELPNELRETKATMYFMRARKLTADDVNYWYRLRANMQDDNRESAQLAIEKTFERSKSFAIIDEILLTRFKENRTKLNN